MGGQEGLLANSDDGKYQRCGNWGDGLWTENYTL